MRHLVLFLLTLLLVVGTLSAQQQNVQAPIASNLVVEIKGRIAKVQVTPGQGMPFLEVSENGKTTKVYLGSMRYLMQNNFNPKAGEAVEVKGYGAADSVTAISVTLPAESKTLRLRDDNGRPLWMGGRHGRHHGPHRGCCGGQPQSNQ